MADAKEPIQSVQVFGRKKTATAVAYCKRGKGIIRVNGKPLEQIEPKPLQLKLQEPIIKMAGEEYDQGEIPKIISFFYPRMTFVNVCVNLT